MVRYSSTTMCHYLDMSVKIVAQKNVPILTHGCATITTHIITVYDLAHDKDKQKPRKGLTVYKFSRF